MRLNVRVCIFSLALFACSVHAQDSKAVATRIVEGLSDATWRSTEAGMPTLLAGVEIQLRNAGATDAAARALTDELKTGLTKEAISQGLAAALEKQMTTDELLEVERFFQSAAGKKYLIFTANISDKPVHLVPVLRKACSSAKSRLSFFEQGSLNGFCSRVDAM